jgi:hypothetical protein
MPQYPIEVALPDDVLRDIILTFAVEKSWAKAKGRAFLGEIKIPVRTPKPAVLNETDIDEVMTEAEHSAVKAALSTIVSRHRLELEDIYVEATAHCQPGGMRCWDVTAKVN